MTYFRLKHVAYLINQTLLSNNDSSVETDSDFTCSYHGHTTGCHT
jgi:hypothetical protein